MSNNIGIAIPRNYNTPNPIRYPVHQSSRVSSIPRVSNYIPPYNNPVNNRSQYTPSHEPPNSENNELTTLNETIILLSKKIERDSERYNENYNELNNEIIDLKSQFTNLEKGFHNLSSVLTNIVDELESNTIKDIVLDKNDKESNNEYNLENNYNDDKNEDNDDKNEDNKDNNTTDSPSELVENINDESN